MNKEALLRLADHIEKGGRKKFNLEYWSVKAGGIDVEHSCGSSGCVAGWQNSLVNQATAVELGVNVRELPFDRIRDLDDWYSAGQDLGLTPAQAKELFTPWRQRDYDDRVCRSVWNMKDPYLATAKRAANLLRRIADGTAVFACDKYPQIVEFSTYDTGVGLYPQRAFVKSAVA